MLNDRIRKYQGEGQQIEMFEKRKPPSFFWQNLPYIVVGIVIVALFATAA